MYKEKLNQIKSFKDWQEAFDQIKYAVNEYHMKYYLEELEKMTKIDETKEYKFSEIVSMLENGQLPIGTKIGSYAIWKCFVVADKSNEHILILPEGESFARVDMNLALNSFWTIKLPEKNQNSIPHFKLTIEDRFDEPIVEIDGEVVDLTDVHYMVFDQRMMLVKNPYATKWISEKIKMSMGIITNENQRNGIFGKIYYMAKNILPWNLDCYREQRQAVDDAIKESKEKYLEEKNKK